MEKDIPYVVFESAQSRAERCIKRLIVALIISIVAVVASNAIWIWYINQYDFESYEITSDDGGNANYIGNNGDIYNGEN